tara:strand:- start:121 stop:399 length:279 start_codon:yes stop_codon:yes gene_type:complete
MNKYYCPYCNPKYQFPLENNGKLVCGLCGEDLIKKPIIQFKQLVAFILVFSFSFPFIFIIFSSIIKTGKDQKESFVYKNSLIKNHKKLLTPA